MENKQETERPRWSLEAEVLRAGQTESEFQAVSPATSDGTLELYCNQYALRTPQVAPINIFTKHCQVDHTYSVILHIVLWSIINNARSSKTNYD